MTTRLKAAMSLAAFGILFVVSTAAGSNAATINETAPAIVLNDLNGMVVTLESLRGKVVFVDFWASWCGPCKQEFPEINRFISKQTGKAVVVLAVNIDKQRSHAEEFLSKMPNLSDRIIVVLDPDSKVVASYNARMMPTSFIIDRSGVVRYIHFGYNESDPASWASEIDALLKE